MSDVNFNATTVKALTTLEGLHGYVGGYSELLTFTVSPSPSTTTSGTFVDIPNMVNQTITTPATGPHYITFSEDTYAVTSTLAAEFQLLVDDSVVVPLGRMYHNDLSVHDRGTFTAIVNLAAGSHTIRPQWRRLSGTGTLYTDSNSIWQVGIQANGAGINGLEVIEDTLVNDFYVTAVYSFVPGGNMAQVDSVQCVVNTLEGERVEVKWAGSVYLNVNPEDIVFGYQVDSNTPVAVHYDKSQDAATGCQISFGTFTEPLSAGQHTIKLMASTTAGSPMIWGTSSTTGMAQKMQVIRYKSFGIGAGTIVTTDTIPSNKSITAQYPTYEDTGFEVTIITIAGEDVLLSFHGTQVSGTGSVPIPAYIAYKVDSDLEVRVTSPMITGVSNADRDNISFTAVIPGMTAGSHTIKLRSCSQGGDGFSILASDAELSAIQFRGGLIPILDEGIEIVDKPSALNFVGAGVTVTASGTNAVITIPGGGGSAIEVQDEGTPLTTGVTKFNFAGAGVTVTEPVADEVLVTIPSVAGATNFLALTDTPGSYVANKLVAVNSGATDLEFIDAPSGNWLGLTDTPSAFSGEAGKVPTVNIGETALEFLNPTRGALGGYMERFVYSGTSTTTSSIYVDMTGMVDQTVETPVSGKHTILVTGTRMFSASSGASMELAVNIDGTDYSVVNYGFNSASSFYDNPSGFIVVDLDAGSHDMRPRWKRTSGSGILSIDAGPIYIQLIGHGTGINGLSVQDDGIVGDVDFTTPATYADTGLEITFDALQGEYVTLTFSGNASWVTPASILVNIYVGYKLDSDADVPIIVEHVGDPAAFTSLRHLEFSRLVGPLSAGSHTLKIRAQAGGSGTRTWRLESDNALMQVVRHLSSEAVLGEIIEVYGGNTIGSTTTSSSFLDVDTTDLNKDNFTATTGGDYLILLRSSAFTSGSVDARVKYRIIFDEDLAGEQVIDPGSGTTWTSRHDDTFDRQAVTHVGKVSLTAGAHTATVQWARVTGAGTVNTDGNCSWSLHLMSAAPTASIGGGGGGGGSSTFTGLTDSPSSYISQGNKLLAVNSAENAVEFITAPSGDFVGLTDTPSSFSGEAGKVPVVNTGETALEFANMPAMTEGAFPGVIATEDVLSSTLNLTTSYQDITSVTFDCIEDETVLVLFDSDSDDSSSTNWENIAFRVLVDGSTHPNTTRNQRQDTAYQYDVNNVPIHISVSLTSGSHTIKVQALTNGATNTGRILGARQTVLQFRGAGINGVEVYEDVVTSDKTITSVYPSYQTTGHSVTFNTLEGEQVEVKFVGSIIGTGAATNAIIGYRIDGGSVEETWQHTTSTSSRDQATFSMMTPVLSAGQHTIEIMASHGTANNYIIEQDGAIGIASLLQVVRFKAFGIGAGSIITTDTLSANKSITSTHPTYEDTGLSIDISVIDGETFLLGFKAAVNATSWGGASWAYKVDGGSDVPLNYSSFYGFNAHHNVSFAVPISGLSSGPHTITLRSAKVTNNFTISYDTGNIGTPTFYAIQYRGGLIPVQDDGVDIVTKPSALNFTGAGVTVTDVNGVATMAIPGGGGGSAIQVEDEGTPLTTDVTKFNFAGAGVTVTEPVTDEMLVTIPGGGGNFLSLTDTPSSFSGEAGKIAKVNDGETALEFTNFPTASFGGFMEALSFVASSTSTSSSSFVDIAGMTNQTFTTPVTGPHLIAVQAQIYASGVAAKVAVSGISIDDGTAIEVSNYYLAVTSQYEVFGGYVVVDLAAGTHTIKPQWKRSSGTGTININSGGPWKMSIQAQGSGINGLEVIEANISSPVVISAINPAWTATGYILTVNVLEGERILLSLNGNGSTSTGGVVIATGYRQDGSTDVYIQGEHHNGGSGAGNTGFSMWTAPLTAGQHTFELICNKASAGTWTLNSSADSFFRATRFKSFGIGAGSIVTEAALTASFTLTATSLAYEDVPDLVVNINTIENEQVLINYSGDGYANDSGSSGYIIMGYNIDGGSDIILSYNRADYPEVVNLNGSVMTAPLTSGPHTIQIRAARQVGGGSYTPELQQSNFKGLQVTQFRGGLIPIQDEGVEIVDKPSAIDFAGAGVTVTQSGTKALVTIPGGGGSSIEVDDEGTPLTTAVTKFDFAGAGVTVTEPVADEMLVTIPGGSSNFLSLTDTPSSFSGEAGKIARVNDAENALEFIDTPNAALGGYQELIIDVQHTTTTDNTNTSYDSIANTSQETFTTPVSGRHVFTLGTVAYTVSGGFTADYRIVIDKGTASEIILGDSDTWRRWYGGSGVHNYVEFKGITELAAGTHTLDAEVKVPSTEILTHNINMNTSVLVEAQGSGINGVETLEDSIPSDLALNSVWPTYTDSGLEITFNTLENERVQINYNGRIYNSGADASCGARVAYQIDSETEVLVYNQWIGTNGPVYTNASFSRMIGPLSAGQHTVKIKGATGSATQGFSFEADDNILQVVRFKSFSIGAGTIVTEDALVSTWTQGTPSIWEDSGLEVTINTIAGERVHLHVNGTVIATTSGSLGFQLRFDIDGTPYGPQHYNYMQGTGNQRMVLEATFTTPELTAGPHTIKVQGFRNGVAHYWGTGTTFQATQFRGGLIPILDEGVSIVDKPSALDFAGTGVTVTQSGTKALITIPGSGGGSGRREVWQIEDGDVPPVASRIGTDLNFATARKFSATVNNDIVFQAPIPDNRAASTDITVKLKYVMETSNAGDVKLDLDYVVADLAVDIDPASADANLTSTFTPGTGAELHRSVTFTVANADIASNDAMIFAHLTRDAIDGADTHTGEFQLIAVELEYTTT